jgi:selenide,water dikinase
LPRVVDPNVLVGTETADDAGIYRLSDDVALVQTVDFFPPVVDDPFAYGQIAAANALSDVYAMGGEPRTALNLVGFPDNKLPLELLGEILRGGAERCAAAGCVVIGGHTVRDAEIKFGLAVTGVVHPQRFWSNAGARPGDRLILTKALGTGLVTTAAKGQKCPPEALAAAIASMIMLNRDAAAVLRHFTPHGVTDVTGFGLAGHGLEMALGSRVTLRFHLADLPLLTKVDELIVGRFFNRASKSNRAFVADRLAAEGTPDAVREEALYDPQTSGGLLVSLPAEEAEAAVAALQAAGYAAACIIGEVLPQQEHALLIR